MYCFLAHCILHLCSSWEISAIEPVVMYDVYVVVNFYVVGNFCFSIVFVYGKCMLMKLKQKKG